MTVCATFSALVVSITMISLSLWFLLLLFFVCLVVVVVFFCCCCFFVFFLGGGGGVMFHLIVRHKVTTETVLTDHNFQRERRAKAKSNRGPSALT